MPIAPGPALTLTKTSDATEPVAVGDAITYSFEVDNTGNVTLTAVTVTDPLPNLSAIDCGDGTPSIASLAPADEPVTCTATYTVTQADIDAGAITNTASVTGTPPGGGDPIPPATDTLTVDADQVSALTLVKTAEPTTATSAGDEITYSFVVTNTGTVTLTDVTVSDPLDRTLRHRLRGRDADDRQPGTGRRASHVHGDVHRHPGRRRQRRHRQHGDGDRDTTTVGTTADACHLDDQRSHPRSASTGARQDR